MASRIKAFMSLLDILQKGTFADYATVTGIVVSTFIAYHIFILSRRLGFQSKMSHADTVKIKVYEHLQKIEKGVRYKVELVNIQRYERDYPHNNKPTRLGYTYLGAGLKTVRYNGIEFFEGMALAVYYDKRGSLCLNRTNKPANFNIYAVGLIPYEWIEYVDLEGDEYGGSPQFFVHFKGKKHSPYSRIEFYKENEAYTPRARTDNLQYEQIEVRTGGYFK